MSRLSVASSTYFSDIGVMVFKNSLDGKILYVKIVGRETVRGYVDEVDRIKEMGYSVQAIIVVVG